VYVKRFGDILTHVKLKFLYSIGYDFKVLISLFKFSDLFFSSADDFLFYFFVEE